LTLVLDFETRIAGDICAITAEGSSIKFSVSESRLENLISFISVRENVKWFKTGVLGLLV
jgi:hypothetical protein